ncbi:MAG: AI-2E family transporter [Bacteroidetes bacterium]|nr:AI-2E family transporter [Bacteroidota bacterium]
MQHQLSLSRVLQIIFFAGVLMYVGKLLFIPLLLGLLIAIVLYPICRWLEMHKWPRSLAIAACLFIVAVLFGALMVLLIWQIKLFGRDADALIKKLNEAIPQLQEWFSEKGIPMEKLEWNGNISSSIGGFLSSFVSVIVDTVFMLFLTPVYTALFLFHRRLFVKFLQTILPSAFQPNLAQILHQIIHTYFNYIKGMILVYLIVGILNSIGLMALGVRHAILFGMLCAIMTIIPYAGIIVSALLPITVVWLDTSNIWYPVGVIALFSVVQYLEANVIFPRVVGVSLGVSTFAILVSIIAGGIVWGGAGMVLFIPAVAILKIVAENIPAMHTVNTLLGRN